MSKKLSIADARALVAKSREAYDKKVAEGPWIFEPHGGYGSDDPDGEPWPFGFVSTAGAPAPIFMLSPILGFGANLLEAAARRMVAAPDLIAALDFAHCALRGVDASDLTAPLQAKEIDRVSDAIAGIEALSRSLGFVLSNNVGKIAPAPSVSS